MQMNKSWVSSLGKTSTHIPKPTGINTAQVNQQVVPDELPTMQFQSKLATLGQNNNTQVSSSISNEKIQNAKLFTAFSGLDLQLDQAGNVISTATAANELLAKKAIEKEMKEKFQEKKAQRKAQELLNMQNSIKETPETALSQALNSFQNDIDNSSAYNLSKTNRKLFKSHDLIQNSNRRLQQRKDRRKQREEKVNGNHSRKIKYSVRGNKSQHKQPY